MVDKIDFMGLPLMLRGPQLVSLKKFLSKYCVENALAGDKIKTLVCL